MADTTIKQGDTWPPLKGRAADANGALPLSTADSIKVIIKSQTTATIIEGTVEVIDPPDTDNNNWQYTWGETDTAELGTYDVEVEITWDTTATPDSVQTVPSSGYQTVEITPDLGGDR